MKMLNIAQAKATLSKLVQEVRAGTEPEIIIALAGTPVAKLVPYGNRPRRALGIDAGLFALPPDFDEPDARIAALFNGSEAQP
jgi:prevent-host-death family protein